MDSQQEELEQQQEEQLKKEMFFEFDVEKDEESPFAIIGHKEKPLADKPAVVPKNPYLEEEKKDAFVKEFEQIKP